MRRPGIISKGKVQMEKVYLVRFYRKCLPTEGLYPLFTFVSSSPISKRHLVDILESVNPIEIYHDPVELGKYIESIKRSNSVIEASSHKKQIVFIEHTDVFTLVVSITQHKFFET